MRHPEEIYIALINEGVNVWKPFRAEQIQGNVYRILEQPYDRDIETWQFEPGDSVECNWIVLEDGPVLAATKRANYP